MPEHKSPPILTERELTLIAERAHNPLLPINPLVARKDLQDLVAYIRELREKLKAQNDNNVGARLTMAALCKREPNFTIKLPIDDVAAIGLHDQLLTTDITEDGREYRLFTYVPKPRIVQ